jgi:hypothetical protein
MGKLIEQAKYQDTVRLGTPKSGTQIKKPFAIASAQMGESPLTVDKQGVKARRFAETITRTIANILCRERSFDPWCRKTIDGPARALIVAEQRTHSRQS